MLSFLAKIIIPFALSSTLFSTNKDHSKPIQQPLCANLETCQIIDLKNETLFQYYKQYVTKNDLSPDFSFENFVDFFNQTGLEFKEFYDQYISDRSTIIPAVTSFSSSADADKYMLSSTFYETTPISLFKNGAPLYNALSYSNVRVGDILFEDKIENFHHMGVVVDTNHSFTNVVGTYNTYIQTIEAVNSQNGVQYGYLDDARVIDHNVKILRYNVRVLTLSEQNNICYFLEQQLGKAYSIHSPLNTSINATSWYCTELVWCAYEFIGLCLAPNLNIVDTMILYGDEIISGNKLSEVLLEKANFLSFTIVSKSSNKWNLKLFNPTNSVVGAQYNTKMCFEDDAKSWTGLNNLQTVAINYHSFAEITISENWFATTIAASYIANSAGINERLITYANNLNSSKKTLSEYAIYRVE